MAKTNYITNVTLYADIKTDDDRTLVFQNEFTFRDYFDAHKYLEKVNVQTIRKNGRLRLELSANEIRYCNYLSFKNPLFDNKTWYCRITNYEYINNECVEISYSIDYWLTFMFDCRFSDMFIDREHLSEADYKRLELNPYDMSVAEMLTAEPLAVSKELEKPSYEIVDDIAFYQNGSSDGVVTRMLGGNIQRGDYDALKTIAVLYLASIDFEALSEEVDVSTKPEDLYEDFLNQITSPSSNTYGFYRKPGEELKTSGGMSRYITGSGSRDTTNATQTHYTLIGCDDPVLLESFINYLTRWNCVSAIINMFELPISVVAAAFGAPSALSLPTARDFYGDKIESHKLLRFPFSYLRLEDAKGDIKELHYEYFEDGNPELCIITDFTERPMYCLAPKNYRMRHNYPKSLTNPGFENIDMSNALIVSDFPTAAYTIDAWLSQMAANAAAQIQQNTTELQYDYASQVVEANRQLRNVPGTYGNVAKQGLGMLIYGTPEDGGSFMNAAANADALNYQAHIAKARAETMGTMADDAYNALAGEKYSNALYSFYAATRPAYACNKYVQQNGNGILNSNYASYVGGMVYTVQLSDAILEKYDKFFNLYGYKSDRIGIPRVLNYVQGIPEEESLPHWVQNDNMDTTYLKTVNCICRIDYKPAMEAIQQMFDNGIILIRGESL